MSEWTVHSHHEHPIPADAVLALFAVEGWWPERTAATLAPVLAGGEAVAAWSGERLVGFARLVSDGAYRAYLEDVIVDREFRGAGVARALVEALVTKLPESVLVSLFCAPALVPVYERMGFAATRQTVLHGGPPRT